MNAQSKNIMNGSGKRQLESWIERFVAETENLHTPKLFRKWSAISTIAAALEQKVWLMSPTVLFPNLYVFLIARPGVGKTRTMMAAKGYLVDLPEFHLAPVSMTWASLVDCLRASKRHIIRMPEEPLEYNSMFICADEMGAFIHQYDNEMIDGLAAMYDPVPYSQNRRTNDLKFKIASPQLNILTGSTPTNLMQFMPEKAWGQGFTSRVIMVYGDERIIGDDFASTSTGKSAELIHDMNIINALCGKFDVTAEYQRTVLEWVKLGEPPLPSHPKLINYLSRRKVNIYKLSMISAIDRGNALILMKEDFDRAYNWLCEAELFMPDIFKAGQSNADGQAMDEIYHFVSLAKQDVGISDRRILHFARELVPLHTILRIVEIMERSGQIKRLRSDRAGINYYVAVSKSEIDPLAF